MQGDRQRSTRRGWWIGGAAVLLVAVLVIVLLGTREGFLAGPSAPTGSQDQPSETPHPSTRPAPTAPFSVVDEVPLTLPQELRAAHGTFFLRGGSSYLATFSLSTVKPPEEPGLGMYLGVTFSCRSDDGEVSEWIGGTENLLRGEPVTYRNQLLLTAEKDQVVTCSVRANAPYDDVAAAGATVELDIHWRVSETSGNAASVPSEDRLPMTVDDGDQAFAFTELIAVEEGSPRTVSMLSSLHLTTCTVVNGSREAGQTWCGEDDLHEGGSTFDAELRVDVLDSHGETCATLGTKTVTESLPLERHHQLLPLDAEFTVPEDLCGDRLRASVVVDNTGPASLVVHESNSSLITQAQ